MVFTASETGDDGGESLPDAERAAKSTVHFKLSLS